MRRAAVERGRGRGRSAAPAPALASAFYGGPIRPFAEPPKTAETPSDLPVGDDAASVAPLLAGTAQNLTAVGRAQPLAHRVLSADTGYYSVANLEACEQFVMHRFLAFPVVDEQRKIVGVVDVGLFTQEVLDIPFGLIRGTRERQIRIDEILR